MPTRDIAPPAWMARPRNPLWRGLDRVLGVIFGTLSRVRRTRSIHPRGVTFAATVTVVPRGRATGVPLFDRASRFDAVLRLSRGAGFTGRLFDVTGWALRVEGAFGAGRPLDLMLSSTGRAPIARHVLMPTRGFVASTSSSLFRYDAAGRRRWIAALPIVDRGDEDAPAYRLCVASRWGRWREVARVTVGPRLPVEAGAALHFNVVRNSDPSLHPDGWIQALRDRAYGASERRAPHDGRRDIDIAAGEPLVAPSTGAP
ncbi:MAG: hypothetical protein JWM93_3741 [Frankiales bacterium]|nr:hypothetical protein [Frankiales bacterium]